MNYDHFEREILEYQGEMRRRAERSRILWSGSKRGQSNRHPAAMSRLSHALRCVASTLSNRAGTLVNRLYTPPAHLI